MDKYLLPLLGSSVDEFYQIDSYPGEGDFSHARFLRSYAGGCPLNVAAVCAGKGSRVIALDMLGSKDESTPFLLNEMKKYRFETDHILYEQSVRNGKVLILLSGDQRTMFVIDPIRPPYHVDAGMQDLLNGASYIYSLMHIIERSFSSLEPLLQAKEHGAKILLDGSSKYDDPSRISILYELCDGLFINQHDYARLKEHSPADPKELLLKDSGNFIIVTKGSKGSTLYLKDREIHKPSVNGVNVIDSTGAGDAFAGCFIACLMQGMNYETALSYACVNGAYACTVFGAGGGVCDFATLETFAKEHNYDL